MPIVSSVAPAIIAVADGATTTDILSGVTQVISVANQAVTFLTGNPLCLLFIGASALGIGFGIFRKAKGASGGGRA